MRGFFNRKQTRISPNMTFRLTQEGREKLQEFTGSAESQVLVALETRGTCNLDEISQASGLRKGQVEGILHKLANGGYIQPLSASMMADME